MPNIIIQKNVPLAPFTTFRIGGPAKFFTEVAAENELIEALKYADDNNLRFFVLGGGSNVLVNDNGFDGLIIRIRFTEFKIDIENSKIRVGAGVFLSKLVKESIENGMTGMEWASGIPGTVGGAIRGNARAFGKNTGMAIENITAFDINKMKSVVYANEKCEFKYFGSMFKVKPNLVILSAVIKLEKGDKEQSRKESMNIIKNRIVMHPKEGSPGSFFLNPVSSNEKLRAEFEKDTGKILRTEEIPAGWLIDQAGLKGKKIGGAMVSEKHANFIVNTGNATAKDVIMLASFVKQQMRDKFGIRLQEEVQYVGF